jgi:hypothetical protein
MVNPVGSPSASRGTTVRPEASVKVGGDPGRWGRPPEI